MSAAAQVAIDNSRPTFYIRCLCRRARAEAVARIGTGLALTLAGGRGHLRTACVAIFYSHMQVLRYIGCTDGDG